MYKTFTFQEFTMTLLDFECCLKCQKTVDLKKNIFKCTKCNMTVHNKCMELTKGEKLLLNDENKKKIYFCFRCDGNTGGDTSELQKKLDDYAKSLEELKVEIRRKNEQVINSEPGKDEFEEVVQELAEHQAKSKNIIIFNLTELADSDPHSDELKRVQDILNDVPHPNTGPAVLSVIRMGRVKRTDTIRPLKVMLSSSDNVLSVLRLKAHFTKKKDISIAPDRTLKQRNHMKSLVDELEKRRSKGEDNLIIRYRNGIPTIISKN